MNKYYKRLSLIIMLIMFVNLVAVQVSAEENEIDEIIKLYVDEEVRITFVRQGTLDIKKDKAKPFRIIDENGRDYLDALKIYEQSTYADKLPNHYYYRTVGYHLELLDAD